jgi:diacylglycerol kinase (ATP)
MLREIPRLPDEIASLSLPRLSVGRSPDDATHRRDGARARAIGIASLMASLEPRGPQQVWRALGWSMKGLGAAVRHEPSFRLELYAFALLSPLALLLGSTGLECAILLGSLFGVLIVEMVNSAIEAIVDKASPEHHILAGRAKDMGSAAVFLAIVNVIACWSLILGPQFF